MQLTFSGGAMEIGGSCIYLRIAFQRIFSVNWTLLQDYIKLKEKPYKSYFFCYNTMVDMNSF